RAVLPRHAGIRHGKVLVTVPMASGEAACCALWTMRVLLGIDGSRYSIGAARFIGDYLASSEDVQIDVVHALPRAPTPGNPPSRRTPDLRRVPADVRAMLERAMRRLEHRKLTVNPIVRRGFPATVVPELAIEGRYDLVVVGAKGRSDAPFLDVGSVALAVLEHVPTSVLMTRERDPRRRRQRPGERFHAVLATDGSAYAAEAADAFFRFFEFPDLAVTAVAVADVPEPATLRRMSAAQRKEHVGYLEAEAKRWIGRIEARIERHGVTAETRVLRGRPAKALVEAAEKVEADLIVLGSRGAYGTWGPRLGSTALGVARRSPSSVLIVRSPNAAED